MRILRLRAYYEPEQVAGTHMYKDINQAYANADIYCNDITPIPTRGVTDEIRNEYKKKKMEAKYDGKIIVQRFSMIREGRNPLQRAFRYALCNIAEFFIGCKENNIDIVYCASTPPTQGLLGVLVAKRLSRKYGRKVAFVYELQDVFPDSLINSRMIKERSVIWKIGRKIEDFTYKHADKIIVISDRFKRNIMAKGVQEEKIEVIYNWIDETKVYPIQREQNILFKKYSLEYNKFYITYCGNIGHSQNFELLIEAAKELIAYKDIEFILFGEGVYKKQLENIIHESQITNVKLLPFQPYENIAHVFSLGDVGLVVSKPNIGTSSVPSKTWSIMAAGRPVLASFDLNSELCDIISKNRCGVCVEAGDLTAFVNCILKIKNDKDKLSVMGKNARKFILDNLTKEVCTSKYVELLNSIK